MFSAHFRQFTTGLKRALEGPLPGREAQLEMANKNRYKKLENPKIPEDAGHASVMVLFFPDSEKMKLVFIKRTEYDGVHSGQISFAGGKKELDDPDEEYTALRECSEEIGVDKEKVTLLGRLSDLYIPPSNFLVTPVVGFTDGRPHFIPEPSEVAEVIEVDLDDLLTENAVKSVRIQVGAGFNFNAPAFCPNGHIIWGATAMILNELLKLIKLNNLHQTLNQKS